MPNFNEMLQNSYETISDLQSKLEGLDKIYTEITQLKDAALKGNDIAGEIPNELKILSEKYLKQIGIVTENYISISNNVLENNQVKFNNSNERFEKLLNQLSKVDLENLFNELKSRFLEDSAIAIHSELSKVDEKAKLLQAEVDRLSKIDLDKGFNELQDTLSKIFNAINSINGTLTSVTGTLNNIITTLGSLQSSISDGFSNTLKSINKLESNILSKLVEIEGNNIKWYNLIDGRLVSVEQQIKAQFELCNQQINLLSSQNDILTKELKNSKMILFFTVGLTLVIILLLLFKSSFMS